MNWHMNRKKILGNYIVENILQLEGYFKTEKGLNRPFRKDCATQAVVCCQVTFDKIKYCRFQYEKAIFRPGTGIKKTKMKRKLSYSLMKERTDKERAQKPR